MKYSHIFLDFDETLFNHHAYFDWLDGIIAGQTDTGGFQQTSEDFHEHKGENLRLYDHAGHMQAVSGKSWDEMSGEIEQAMSRRSKDFCYSDTHKFLHVLASLPEKVRVLTYGNGEYQRFKLQTCPILRKLYLPVHVVDRPKRDFLAKTFPDVNGVLIDDKYPLNLPHNWLHIWIDRTEDLLQPKILGKNVYKVSNLKQVISELLG